MESYPRAQGSLFHVNTGAGAVAGGGGDPLGLLKGAVVFRTTGLAARFRKYRSGQWIGRSSVFKHWTGQSGKNGSGDPVCDDITAGYISSIYHI